MDSSAHSLCGSREFLVPSFKEVPEEKPGVGWIFSARLELGSLSWGEGQIPEFEVGMKEKN